MATWTYDLYLYRRSIAPATLARSACDILWQAGMTWANPATGKIDLTTDEGGVELHLIDAEEALEVLAEQGGTIPWWYQPDPKQEILVKISLGITYQDQLTGLSITVDSSVFEPYQINREQVAGQAFNAYYRLCEWLNPVYGLSADDLTIDRYLDQIMDIATPVTRLQTPPVLFWLNYLSNDYAAAIGMSRLEATGGGVTWLPGGLMLSFYSFPWEVTLEGLAQINQGWQAS